MRRRKVLRARRWYSAFSREERAQLSRRRAPAPSKSAASPAATAERMPTIAPSSPSAASAIAPPAHGRRTPPSAAAIAAAFTPVVIRSSSGRESVRVCGRSIDVATDEAHAGREQPDEPGGEPWEPDEQQGRTVRDGEISGPGHDQQASARYAEQALPRTRQPSGVGGQRRADEGGPESRQRECERRRVELPGELERRGRLGESACGEDDSDEGDGDEGKDRGESRTGGDGEVRPVGPRSPAPPDEPVETGHEDEQQRQFHRLQ